MATKDKAVRVTDEAHALLADKAEDYDLTQKDIASEAILLLLKRKDEDRFSDEAYMYLLEKLKKIKQDNRRYAFGTFALGAIAGGSLMFFVGVVW